MFSSRHVGSVRGRQARFQVYPKDHLPVHTHARIGAGEVIIEVRRDGSVRLSQVHRDSVVGKVKDREIRAALTEAADYAKEIRAEWQEMQK